MSKEREFLHDLASPLATLQLIVSVAAEDSHSPQQLVDLKVVLAAIEEASLVLAERRTSLMKRKES